MTAGGTNAVRRKWRPSMALVIAAVCIILVSVPVLALLALRMTSNQFIRETERSLISQAAIYAAIYRQDFLAQGGQLPGRILSEPAREFWEENIHPIRPSLNLRSSEVFGPLPDIQNERDEEGNLPEPLAKQVALKQLDQRHLEVFEHLVATARVAGKTTLSGAIFLDHLGENIGVEVPFTHRDEPEVAQALSGAVGTALRARTQDYARHPLSSMSRDTWYRVFVAYPVIAEQRVIGVVYLSRTPSNIRKFFHNERAAILTMLLATLITAALVGFLLLRLIMHPVRALSEQTERIVAGETGAPQALSRYGIKELAMLGDNVMRMAKTLTRRAQEISVYTNHVTHELKSPVTAIVGAGELLKSNEISPQSREQLQKNVLEEGLRMNALLEQLRELTRLKDAAPTGSAKLVDVLPTIEGLEIINKCEPQTTLPFSPEHAEIVLLHLAKNAREHKATTLTVSTDEGGLSVHDNGIGIKEDNQNRIFEPFFTTRREEGGTGMGLAIIQTILEGYEASIETVTVTTGTRFDIRFGALRFGALR